MLTEDSEIDRLLTLTARLFAHSDYFTPSGELEHELALRYDEKAQTESEFVAALLCDTLQPDAKGQQGTWAGKH
ncbi:MAG: hypothetical protein NT075_23450, partial [Chloroflexi bacterium]|nr:hypothetical protein [Chloroflexota bacterium]